MAVLWQTLAFCDTPREVIDAGWVTPIRLKPYQILAWVSLTHRGLARLPHATPRIPALLDTGHNHNFSLREQHLTQSGLETPWPWSSSPLKVRDSSAVEHEVPRLLLDLWLHPDAAQPNDVAYPLRLGFRGAACYLAAGPVAGPHLPLLGLAALCAGSLTAEFQCNPSGGTVRLLVPAPP